MLSETSKSIYLTLTILQEIWKEREHFHCTQPNKTKYCLHASKLINQSSVKRGACHAFPLYRTNASTITLVVPCALSVPPTPLEEALHLSHASHIRIQGFYGLNDLTFCWHSSSLHIKTHVLWKRNFTLDTCEKQQERLYSGLLQYGKDYCNRREKLNSTLGTVKTAGDVQPKCRTEWGAQWKKIN